MLSARPLFPKFFATLTAHGFFHLYDPSNARVGHGQCAFCYRLSKSSSLRPVALN